MCVIRVGGEEAEFLSITLFGRSYPDAAEDGWSAPCLLAEVEVSTGNFRGRVTADLRSDELAIFAGQLARLLDTMQGTAQLRTMESWLALTITSDRRGHLTMVGELRDGLSTGNMLTFALEYDQTYFQPMLIDLRAAVERFPVVGLRER